MTRIKAKTTKIVRAEQEQKEQKAQRSTQPHHSN